MKVFCKKTVYQNLAVVCACSLVIGLVSPITKLFATETAPSNESASPTPTAAVSATQQNSPKAWHPIHHYTQTNQSVLFDHDWKFRMYEGNDAFSLAFDDSAWQNIDLPHDFSLDQEYTRSGEAESGFKLGGTGWYRKSFTVSDAVAQGRVLLHFDGAYMETEVYINGERLGLHPYGYTPFTFDLTPHIRAGQENLIAVKVANRMPSSRWYSGSGIYRSVHLQFTPKVHIDEYGVAFKTPQLATTYNTDTPTDVSVTTRVKNTTQTTANVKVRSTLFEKTATGINEQAVASAESQVQSLQASAETSIETPLQVTRPRLWSPAEPNLYVLRTELFQDDVKIHSQEQEVGFRFFSFDKANGFQLNGEWLKLQGVCMHHDQGGLGAKAYYDAILRQFQILKDMGVNAVRVTHNPSARYMKDIANRVGMLLIDEAFDTWERAKNSNHNDYARFFNQAVGENSRHLVGARSAEQKWSEFHVKQMVKAGLNDPSIIMWSLGNEVMEGISGVPNNYATVIGQLAAHVYEVDTTRPVTLGDNKLKQNGWQEAKVMADVLDGLNPRGIVGFNYAGAGVYDNVNSTRNWIIYGSETASVHNSRGIYNVKNNERRADKQVTAYDQHSAGWGHVASQAWYDTIYRDFVAGEFVWTGFDYLGEPTPWNNTVAGARDWPAPKSSYFGIVDTAGIPKDSYYFYRSQWNKQSTTLHVLPAWHENVVKKDNQQRVEVVVYSNAPKVELFFENEDGTLQSLGKRSFETRQTNAGHRYQIYTGEDRNTQHEHKNLYLTWYVPYQNGALKAVAYNEQDEIIEQTVGTKYIKTFGAASRVAASLYATPQNVDNQNLAYVNIEVQDAEQQLVANAENTVYVDVSGPAELVALDNGSAMDHQSYLDNHRKVFSGKMTAILKMKGESGRVNVNVRSQGLSSANLSFDVAGKQNSTREAEAYELAKTIYVKAGTEPTLPSRVRVRFTDGSIEEKDITFDRTGLSEALASGNPVAVRGTIADIQVQAEVLVSVIAQVAVAKNIALATERGQVPNLPSSVQVYKMDGNLLSSQFPVVWNMPEESAFQNDGVVVVQGQADVLGESLPVKASVRVTGTSTRIVGNVAPNAYLSQDLPENLQSDHLNAIVDGSLTVSANNSGGRNMTLWSNYAASQQNQRQATLNFVYDTAQSLSEIVMYYHRDNASLRNPASVAFSWKASRETEEKTPIAHTEVRRETVSGLTKVTYRLAQVIPAESFHITVESANETIGSRKASVGLAEVQLMTAVESFERQSVATLTEVRVGDRRLTGSSVAPLMKVTGVGKVLASNTEHNVGITLLPLQNQRVRIFTESEDKTRTGTYVVEMVPESPSSEDKKYLPRANVRLEAGSTESRAGNELSNVSDFNLDTLYHSSWTPTNIDNLWIILDAQEEKDLNGLAYMQRGGDSNNGKLLNYEIFVSSDKTQWQSVSTGTFANQEGWQEASFTPTRARYVKLQARSTMADANHNRNRFLSASELRISERRNPDERIALTEEHLSIDQEERIYNGRAFTPEVTVIVENRMLEKGTDYSVSYENNLGSARQDEQASVIVRGLGRYDGEARKTFVIKGSDPDTVETVNDGTTELPETFTATNPATENALTQAQNQAAYTQREYLVYPKLQNVQYVDGTLALKGTVNLVFGKGVDIYTRNRLKAILQENQISYQTSETSVENSVNIYLGIASRNLNNKAKEHQANAGISTDLFNKIDAYALYVKDQAISIVGKDTDAVFYGVTTLKHLLKAGELPVLRQMKIEDYAHIKNRGFIEGYYGNPWSKEDRIELMRFGGDLKLTQYFFAPKDDAYHNSRWRELYPQDKLAEIKEMARMGNQSKTRYVWTLHPFMHNPVRFNNPQEYANDLQVIKDKFTQLLEVGVREFGILADDASRPQGGFDSYHRLMRDLTQWLESKQSSYDGLRKEMIFVPYEYWGNGTEQELRSLNRNLPASSLLTLTGGKIWGEVSNPFLTQLERNLSVDGATYRPVQMWINWPCTDNSKEHLILGGGEKFLHPNVRYDLVAGIMLNPMQQAEPSKISLFAVSDYTWNVWKSEEEAKETQKIAFNYVENANFKDSETSLAFRELAKHMINQNMDTRVVKLEESVELAPKLTRFLTALENQADLTEAREILRTEFARIKTAAETYQARGQERMKEQIKYWLSNTVDQMNALASLLDATEYIGTDNDSALWNAYHQGLKHYEASKQYRFWYVNHYEKAELGVQHIRPFILKLLDYLAKEVEKELYPDKVVMKFISNRSGAEGGLTEVLDGNLATHAIFKNPAEIATGDYVGLEFNQSIDLNTLTFAMGTRDNPLDTFNQANVEVLNENGQWEVLESTYRGNENVLRFDNVNKKVKGVRMIATAPRGNTWFAVKEIAVNRPLEKERVQGEITISDNIIYKENTNKQQIVDGVDATEAMFAKNSTGNDRDTVPAGAWVQLDLGKTKTVTKVRLVQHNGDKLDQGVIEYSVNGTEWHNLTDLTGQQSKEVRQTIEARYLRVKNNRNLNKWWRIRDFSVETYEGTKDYTQSSQANLKETLVFEQLGRYEMALPQDVQLEPHKFLGIKLKRLHEIENLQAENLQANLQLLYSPNGVEWYTKEQMAEKTLVRYVRIVNPTEQAQNFGAANFVLNTKEVHPDRLDSTTMNIHSLYGNNDVRRINNLHQLFDGVYNNFVEFSDTPTQDGNIVIELGTQRPIQKIRAYIQDGTNNYLRDGKIQVSLDKQQWTDVVTVGDTTENGVGDDSLTDGWIHDSTLPGNRYIEGSLTTPVEAKYIRVLFTARYRHRFVGFTEMVINDGAFVKAENLPVVQGSGTESRKNEKHQLTDGKVLTAYQTSEPAGELIYHLSDKTKVNHIKLISDLPQGSQVQVLARVSVPTTAEHSQNAQTKWVEAGQITSSFQTLSVAQAKEHLLDVKLVWQGGAPTLYELSTYFEELPEEQATEEQPTPPENPATEEQPTPPENPTTEEQPTTPENPATEEQPATPENPQPSPEGTMPVRLIVLDNVPAVENIAPSRVETASAQIQALQSVQRAQPNLVSPSPVQAEKEQVTLSASTTETTASEPKASEPKASEPKASETNESTQAKETETPSSTPAEVQENILWKTLLGATVLTVLSLSGYLLYLFLKKKKKTE